MLGRLLRLVIFTRFSKFYIGFLFASVMISIILAFDLILSASLIFRSILIGGSLFFIYYFTITGSVPVLRSDVDFLFTSPINDRDKAISLLTAKYVFVGLTLVDILLWTVGPASSAISQRFQTMSYILFLSVAICSLSLISSSYRPTERTMIAAPIMLYNILFFVLLWYGTPSFLSTTYLKVAIVDGTPPLIAIPLLLYSYTLLKGISSDNLGQIAPHIDTRAFLKTHNTLLGEQISFNNIPPRRAMLRFNLARSHSTLTGKNFSSDSVVRISQGPTLRLALILGIAVATSTVVGGLVFVFYRLLMFYYLFITVIAIYTLVGITFTYSTNALSLERGWLSFTSAHPGLYMRYVIFARMIKASLISSPIGAAFVILHFLLGLSTLGVAYVEFFDVPMFVVPILLLNIKLGVFQIQDPAFITPQRKVRQFLDMGPISILIIFAVISLVSVTAVFIVSIVLLVLSIFLLGEKKIWLGAIYRMTESGFI
jgi:hypothetical protein